ncbi:phosphatase PAP2 family protein [Micavibrio aeruginosavorus]|uniref:phosphatase PAP2 family protein n=1 Tax=Micavibrio aeruginosavorus TaxID=349221 RepID=UPI003F4AB976
MKLSRLQKFWPYTPAVTGWVLAVAVYAVAGWGLSLYLGAADQFSPFIYSRAVVTVTFLLFSLFLGWRGFRMMIVDRPDHLTRELIADLRRMLFNRRMLVAAAPLFFAFILFMGTFTSLKSMIPLVQDYQWDETFATWDRILHFGIDPWRILHPVFGYAPITFAINLIYNLWFAVMFGVLYWQLFNLKRPVLRMRFFWTFLLTWIMCGNVLAMGFSSGGPCFYSHLVDGPNPFAAQMDYFHSMGEAGWPVWALQTQDMLWTTYQANATGIGSGISAMPSVHVALAFLFFLLSRSYGRGVQWFFGTFALIIMIGSVHLAWHYALDGYLGAAVAALIWWACGLVLKEPMDEKLV